MKLRLLSTLLVGIVLALVLAACGGDDGGSGDSAQTPPAAQTPTTGATGGATTGAAAQEGTTGERARKPRRKRQRQAPPPEPAEEQQQAPKESAATKRKAKKLAQRIDQGASREYKADVSYDAARKLCKTGKMKDLRAFYKFKNDEPQTIARAVAKFYKPAFRREAAYNGCVKGLSER
jgi:hypothetical protein